MFSHFFFFVTGLWTVQDRDSLLSVVVVQHCPLLLTCSYRASFVSKLVKADFSFCSRIFSLYNYVNESLRYLLL